MLKKTVRCQLADDLRSNVFTDQGKSYGYLVIFAFVPVGDHDMSKDLFRGIILTDCSQIEAILRTPFRTRNAR